MLGFKALFDSNIRISYSAQRLFLREPSGTDLPFGLAFYLFLISSYFLYSTGLPGGFMIDDGPNLKGLADIKKEPTLAEAWRFVLHGTSSTLGRPLSLATFAPQYYLWPWSPEGFKQVNIFLHLLNGCILFWLLIRLTRLSNLTRVRGLVLSVAVSGIWLIHPLQISTLLYVVQRMAELSALFVLLGLSLYLYGRDVAARGKVQNGYFWMSAGLVGGLGLGVLAKENAILLPLFVLIIEFTLLQNHARPQLWHYWGGLFIGLPLAGLILYLAIKLPSFSATYDTRDFTPYERLLTECRILLTYLGKLFIPRLSSYGLLYDDYPISRGLFDPISTVFSLAGISCFLIVAFYWRKRAPVIAFAALWFLGAHLLESTFIPLELVFEHRNYIAMVGPLFAVSYYGLWLFDRASARHVRVTLKSIYVAFILFCGLITWQVSTLWGHPLELTATWAAEKPDSRRAQDMYGNTLLIHSDPTRAVGIYKQIAQKWQNDPSPLLAITEIACYYPQAHPPDRDDILERLSYGRDNLYLAVINFLDRIVTAMEDGQCSRHSPWLIQEFVAATLDNPFYWPQRQNLLLLYSRTAELAGNREVSLDYLKRAIEISPRVLLLIQAILWEFERANLEGAQRYLSMANTSPRVSDTDRWSYRQVLKKLHILLDRSASLDGARLDPARGASGIAEHD
jgi:hypothetical protein